MKVLVIVALSLACVLADHHRGSRHHGKHGGHHMHMRPTGRPMMDDDDDDMRPTGRPMHGGHHGKHGGHHMHMRPTGRPMMDDDDDDDDMRPTGRPMQSQSFWKNWKDTIAKWKNWQHMDDDDADDTAIVGGMPMRNHMGPMGQHPMRPHSMGPRPTGRPMGPHSMGPRPTGRPMGPHHMGPHHMGPHHMGPHHMGPRPTGRPMGPHHMGMGDQFWKDRQSVLDAWKNKMDRADEDETEVVAGDMYRKHFSSFNKYLSKLLKNRPTGRPGSKKALLKSVSMAFRKAAAAMKQMRPTGRPQLIDHNKHMEHLKKMFNKAKQRVMNMPGADTHKPKHE